MGMLRAREREKRSHRAIQKKTNEAGNNTTLTPIVMLVSDGGLLEARLRTGGCGRQVQNDATTGDEVHVEHHAGAVVLGHVPEN